MFTKHYGVLDFFTHGKEFKVWGNSTPFSPCICYEETFSELIRKAKLMGSHLMINLTNDNYYPDSILHRQHLFHARLRTVENGIPLIRSCNAGISAAIDSSGQIVAQMDENQSGVLNCRLSSYVYRPSFSFYGEWGVISFLILIGSCCWIFSYYIKNEFQES
jgi:apolipoprotein N-acyltransferase